MSTARLVLCCLVLLVLPIPVSAEMFEVWADAGDVFAREIATGQVINLTAIWDYPAWEPDVAAYTAVFTTATPGGVSIHGYDLDNRFPLDLFGVFWSTDENAPSQPRIGVVDPTGLGDYWCAFYYRGGIWAQHIKPPVINSDAYEALAGYTDWFDVEADQLLYAGGAITLADQAPPDVPEPSTLMLLTLAIIVFSVRYHWPSSTHN